MFFNYYYFSELIICVFCFNYIFINNKPNNSIFFISSQFFFICKKCLILCNKLVFNKNNNVILNYINNNISYDFYDNYIYCKNYCISCHFYFNPLNYKNYFENVYMCNFIKNINYTNFKNDYYDYYKYCNISVCMKCFIYFKDIKFRTFFKKYKYNYIREINFSYNFFKIYDNLDYFLCPQEINNFLDKFIVGQNLAKKYISLSIYNHYKRIKLNIDFNFNVIKSNILLIGPSGSGKTFILKTISKILNIPIVIIDATTLTETGYVGEDVENIIQKLFNESGQKVKDTEIGMVFIDEIDKISFKKNNFNSRDISGEGVQQSLLKIIESTYCKVSYKNNLGEQIFLNIKTDNILFICGGAFPGLKYNNDYKINEFTFNNEKNDKKKIFSDKLNLFDTNNLIEYGLIPELVGRLPIVVIFKNLDIIYLNNILSSSDDSIVSNYNHILTYENVNLLVNHKASMLIAEMAVYKSLGSRGLKSIIDNLLLDITYKIPNLNCLKKILIHKNITLINSKPILIYAF